MANRLASEKSPYLLQHADNPVHWLPWGEAAFAQARAEQKPIFLSIGYSTCHWCHVMAHESFESEEVAALLNTHFVSIKVDREERPDVDRVYMHYVQAMTGHGGWPLSAWLTPELHPFFGGTYFSLEDRNGRAGFKTILTAIANGWATERAKFVGESARVLTALREQAAAVQVPVSSEGDLTELAGDAFEKCFHYFYENFDGPNGGFGGAPKFPRASNINFLFRAATIQGIDTEAGKEAVTMAVETLKKMACGGIHDHVGGGFHRYSVDEAWFVPHFEKMLYDQAQIAINYLEAKQATGEEAFAWVARGIFEYTQRELASPQGGFYSAEDADSEADDGHKIEGAFYVWTKSELDELLGEKSALVCAHFGVIESGNVPAQLDPQGELSGKNVLMQRQSLADTAKLFGLELAAASGQLVESLAVLREARVRRARPHLDDKIITAWNGLMISALAKGAQVLGEASLAATATRAAEFLQSELYDAGTGILYRSYRHGRSEIQGFAEDYAYLVQGLIDLYETTFEIRWLQWAEQLQQTLDVRFGDETGGGYFNSRAGDAAIVLRLKEDYDGAEPTPSSVGAMNHLRLAAISVDGDRLRARAKQTLLAFRPRWTEQPQALPQMLCAMEMALEVPRQVVLAGEPDSAAFRAMTAVLHAKLGARRVVLAADGGVGQTWLSERVAALKTMTPVGGGQVAAYVCEHYTCVAPVTDPVALAVLLRG